MDKNKKNNQGANKSNGAEQNKQYQNNEVEKKLNSYSDKENEE